MKNLNRRLLLTSAFCLAASSLSFTSAAAETADGAPTQAPVNQAEVLTRVSDYLNSLTTMKGSFTQFEQNGHMSEGLFYLHRPGRLRFEYQSPPDAPIIVADGSWVFVEDRRLKTTNRFPLSATPLHILLKGDLNLEKDANIVGVEAEPGILRVTAREDVGPAKGELTMVFSDPAMELRNWVIKDSRGLTTTVSLSNVRRDISLAPSLFESEDDALDE